MLLPPAWKTMDMVLEQGVKYKIEEFFFFFYARPRKGGDCSIKLLIE